MQLTCPDCRLDCTVDELSTETFSCPSCGLLLFSRSGDSAPAVGAPAVASVNEVSLEATRQWQPEGVDVLTRLEPLPRKLGRYQLNELLGRGSFGLVFRAFDSQLGREVAIKIPHRHRFESSEGLSKLLDEARTAARIEHPGIVRIYDVGWLTDDLCFISMEFCPSGTLETLAATGRMPPERAVQIITEVAEAVHFAHLQGFVHRDLKPSNIMFGRDGRPRVVDFGLALSDELQLKTDGEVAGTLPYMSPEQVRGETQFFDGRTDIWSLGIVLYQLLTGQRPFQGTKHQLARQICDRQSKPLRQIVNDIPVELEQICLKCLAKPVAERWATAGDLASALRNVLLTTDSQSSSVVTSVASAAPSVNPWRRVALLVVLLFVVLAGGQVANSLMNRDRGTPSNRVNAGIPTTNDQPPAAFLLPKTSNRGTGGLPANLIVWRIYDLFDVSPKELFWSPDPRNGTWHYDAARKHVHVDNGIIGFLQVGVSNFPNYTLELGLQKRNPEGRTGVLFGLPEGETVTPKMGTKLGTVYLECGIGGKPRIQRSVMTRTKNREGTPRWMDAAIAHDQIPQPLPLENRLELTIENGQLWNVRLNGVEYPSLADRRMTKPEELSGCQGVFGIINMSGSATLTYFRFTLH